MWTQGPCQDHCQFHQIIWIKLAYLGRPKYQKKASHIIKQNLLFENAGWEKPETMKHRNFHHFSDFWVSSHPLAALSITLIKVDWSKAVSPPWSCQTALRKILVLNGLAPGLVAIKIYQAHHHQGKHISSESLGGILMEVVQSHWSVFC